MAESWKKLKTSNLFSSFIVSSNRNRSAVVRELLCNNSLFVGQSYEDKSLKYPLVVASLYIKSKDSILCTIKYTQQKVLHRWIFG